MSATNMTEITGITAKPNSAKWLVAIAVMSSAVMEVLDTSVVNVSMPHIAGNLGATTDEATWVLTSYIVANAVILPITGWLANYMGRKRLLLTVVTGFTVSSMLCGLAWNLPSLILFRILQGTTGGGLQPLSQAVLLEEFPPEERGKAMGFWGLGIVAAPIMGPALGGWLTDAYSWRWVFYINLPIGIASLVMISLFLHDPPYIRRGTLKADVWGLLMLAVGMGSLQVMLDKGQEEDWFSSNFIRVLTVMAVLFLTWFVVRQLRSPEAIVHFGLLKYRSFFAGIILVTVMGFVLYGSLILLPLFMQTLLGWTAVTAGIWTSPRGIGTAICMPIAGYLLGKRFDGRYLVAGGFLIAGWAFFGYSHLTLQSGTWDIFWHQINQGVGMAFVFVPLTTLTMAPIPREETGYATSLYSVMRNIGSSFGISFVTTWLARRGQVHQATLAADVTQYGQQAQQLIQQSTQAFMHGGADTVTATRQALAALYGTVQQQAALLSFVDVFRIMGWLFIIAVPAVFLMKRADPRKKTDAAAMH
jgi:DHA2 family multidrug resistance protein